MNEFEAPYYVARGKSVLVFINGDLAGHFDYADVETAERVARAFNA
ncbi:hypothetical protein [Secundilactobacillus similis]|nr:hypothetical protein [Secundilactobacillus similis]